MSIHAKCECGNKMMLADVMAGKTIRCSKCGGDVFVPDAPAAPASAKKKDATPAFEISSNILVGGTIVLVLLAIALGLYFGPWSVGKKWSGMAPKANTDVTDVVQFALQAYESQTGMYDTSESHHVPTVDGQAVFVPPAMAFLLPQRMIFSGKTNQGGYIGTYDTTTGEVIADIQYGGYTVGGLVDVKAPTGNIHITGREKDGNVSAEINGQPLKIIYHKAQIRASDVKKKTLQNLEERNRGL